MAEETKVCSECGYDQLDNGRCPMCGNTAKAEPAKASKKDEGKK